MLHCQEEKIRKKEPTPRHDDSKFFAETGHTLPAKLTNNNIELICEMVQSAVNALGLSNGIAHVEAKLTEDGPRIIEIGARMPGDYIPHLLHYALGIDIGKIYLQIALGEEPNCKSHNTKYASIRFITSNSEGIISEINGLDYIRNNATDLELYKKVGDRIGFPINNIERIGHFIVVDNTYCEVQKKADNCFEHLDIVVK